MLGMLHQAWQPGARQLQVIQNGNQATVNLFLDGDNVADLVIDVTVADGHTLTAADFTGVQGAGAEPLEIGKPVVADSIGKAVLLQSDPFSLPDEHYLGHGDGYDMIGGTHDLLV